MKTRYIWMAFGFGFFVTLAVIVGQRLSSEAMAVMVGVIAGVAASIPTSLIVVWFATRTIGPRHASETLAEKAEPRIIVMAQPAPDPRSLAMTAMASGAGYQNFTGYPPIAQPLPVYPQAIPTREFTVIGGAQVALDEPSSLQEVVWPR
jgi:hypothetical protein